MRKHPPSNNNNASYEMAVLALLAEIQLNSSPEDE